MSDLKLTTAFLRVLTDHTCSVRARRDALQKCRPSKHTLSLLLADRRVKGKFREDLTARYEEETLKRELLYGKKNGRPPGLHVDRHAPSPQQDTVVN